MSLHECPGNSGEHPLKTVSLGQGAVQCCGSQGAVQCCRGQGSAVL